MSAFPISSLYDPSACFLGIIVYSFLPSPDLTYLFAMEVSACNHFLEYLLLSLCHCQFSVPLLLVGVVVFVSYATVFIGQSDKAGVSLSFRNAFFKPN